METTSKEVIATFAVTPRTRALLRQWQADPRRPHVPRTVLRHTTRVLYQLVPSRIEAVCKASEHPLGNIRKEAAMAVQPVLDWRPPFPFTPPTHLPLDTRGAFPPFHDLPPFPPSD